MAVIIHSSWISHLAWFGKNIFINTAALGRFLTSFCVNLFQLRWTNFLSFLLVATLDLDRAQYRVTLLYIFPLDHSVYNISFHLCWWHLAFISESSTRFYCLIRFLIAWLLHMSLKSYITNVSFIFSYIHSMSFYLKLLAVCFLKVYEDHCCVPCTVDQRPLWTIDTWF